MTGCICCGCGCLCRVCGCGCGCGRAGVGTGGAGGTLTGSRTPKSLISNLCGLQLSVALPSLVMQSFPGFFSISTGSSRRDLSGLVQNFSKMSPSTHLRRERSSDSCMTRLVQVSHNLSHPKRSNKHAKKKKRTSRPHSCTPSTAAPSPVAPAAPATAHPSQTSSAHHGRARVSHRQWLEGLGCGVLQRLSL